jgi:Fe(3+) dicitrate transport protein
LIMGTNARTYVSQGVQVNGEFNYDADWFGSTLKLGFRLHADEIRRDHDEGEYDMISGTMVRASDIVLVKQNTGSALALSGYALEEIRLGDHIRISPGLRFESIETELADGLVGGDSVVNEDLVLVPGVGAWFALGDHWGLLAGVHQGFSPSAPGSSKNTEPEVSTNYEFGSRFSYARVKGEVIGFYNDYENLVGTCTQSAGCASRDLDTQFNAGQAQILGVEAIVNGVLLSRRGLKTELSLTYTWTQAQFQTGFSSDFSQWGQVSAGDELPYVPQHQVGLKVSNQYQKVGLTASGTFVSDMRDVAGQGPVPAQELIPSHMVMDLAGFYRPTKEGRVYLTVDNVLNTTYMVSRRPFGARPGKRFQLNLGYQHQF